jgi:hypothetical protein
MIKSKNLLIRQGIVSGVRHRSRMNDVGARSSAVTNLKAIKRKGRTEMETTNNFNPEARIAIREFEAWQMKVFKKNAKKGWRFFNPDAFDRPTPRSAKEAWGGTYNRDDSEKNEDRNQKILLAIVAGILILLSII